MKRSGKISLIIGGLLLGLAAFPVFAQEPVDPAPVVINRQPLTLFRNYVKDEMEKKEVDLNAPFSVEMEGYFTSDGKLELSRTKFVRMEGDRHILELVKNGIGAINDAGYLQYLSMMSGKSLHLSIVQDDTNFSLTVLSELDSPRRAKSIESIFKLHISKTIERKQRPDATPDDKDNVELLKNVIVTAESKKIAFRFTAPKSSFQAIIKRKAAAGIQGNVIIKEVEQK